MNELVQLFWRGLIVGPEESQSMFLERIASLSKKTTKEIISIGDIKIDWLPIHYSNRGLRLWEGGCCWVEGRKVTLQLRQRFKLKERLFGIYSKHELTAHEAVHAIRSQFEEPVFEEFLAYKTSPSRFRKEYGPLFRAPWESLVFVVLIALMPFAFSFVVPFIGIGVCLLLYRLKKNSNILIATEKKLGEITKQASELLIALTDKEIVLFARSSCEEIKHYVNSQHSFRWQQIKEVFFT